MREEGFRSGKGGLLCWYETRKSQFSAGRGGREDNHLVLLPLPMQTRPSAYNSLYPRFQADMNVSFVYCQVFGCLRICVGYGGRVGVDDWCCFGCGWSDLA